MRIGLGEGVVLEVESGGGAVMWVERSGGRCGMGWMG